MARPYYEYTCTRRSCRQSLVNKSRKKLSELASRIWTDDMFCITLFRSLFFLKGLWPADDHPSKPGYWFRYCNPRLALATSCFLLFVSMPITTYQARSEELIAFLEPVAFSFLNIMLSVQLVSFVDNSAEFSAALRSLQAVRESSAILKHRPSAMLKRSRQLSVLVLLYFGVCMFCAVLFSFGLAAVLYTIRKHHTQLWYPYDGYLSPYYEITLVGWACLIFTGGFVIGLVNSFLMALLVQAIGQLDILSYNIRQIGPSSQSVARNTFVRSVNIVFWPILVVQYVCSVVPTFIAIVLVTHSELDMRILFFITLIIMCNVSLALFCWLANQLTEQSALVMDAVYSCDWFTASHPFSRSMRMMMLMSNKPLVLNVAGKTHLSMESFLAVMKLTYSYYMTAMATVRRELVAEKIRNLAKPDVL